MLLVGINISYYSKLSFEFHTIRISFHIQEPKTSSQGNSTRLNSLCNTYALQAPNENLCKRPLSATSALHQYEVGTTSYSQRVRWHITRLKSFFFKHAYKSIHFTVANCVLVAATSEYIVRAYELWSLSNFCQALCYMTCRHQALLYIFKHVT